MTLLLAEATAEPTGKYHVKILQALIPTLRNGARVIINDNCMSEPGKTAFWREKELRCVECISVMLGANFEV